jgi:glycolate oxidase iron-sulfur subunit
MTGNFIKYAGNIQAEKDFILTEAGRCVACGLCLPHCPTYQLTQVETESPRGRISLISALANADLAASDNLDTLLQHCLLCRACENMCPSSVSFSILMDKGRHLHRLLQPADTIKKQATNKLIDYLLNHPEWIRLASYGAALLNGLGRNKPDKPLQRKRTFADYLASIKPHRKWENNYPAKKTDKQVALFLGCVSRSTDGDTLDDAIFILNKIAYSVIIPASQVCCGALSLHAGREKESLAMMKRNIQSFESTQHLPIIYTATGCGTSLDKYHNYLTDNGFSSRIIEVCQFLDSHWPEEMTTRCQKQKVLLHSPCSLESSSKIDSAPYRILSRFRNLNIIRATSSYNCCGASGTKMLTDVTTSNALREPLLNQIIRETPDVVVTSNIGCALHLAEGLRHARLNIPVRHPVSLIADILRENILLDRGD